MAVTLVVPPAVVGGGLAVVVVTGAAVLVGTRDVGVAPDVAVVPPPADVLVAPEDAAVVAVGPDDDAVDVDVEPGTIVSVLELVVLDRAPAVGVLPPPHAAVSSATPASAAPSAIIRRLPQLIVSPPCAA
ncbi:MAG TPA: hypothetical protein VFW24_00280 [Acidimicrobiales bacterium]|nr:hypothetical protein [Acidimicrobiales bacterium]